MVAKGVLKEHLTLLASSMTNTGTLIGFNASGIKAMCRTLGVQVPFTEATLYTPRKCFEKAAEKCHLDSLSSIVASCSWGKHVAIGTGAKFDLLWNEKEATSTLQKSGIDVYDFLQLVRSTHGEEDDIGCLGVDVDKFELEDEYMEEGMSPKDSKAVFDENDMEIDKSDGWEGSAWNSVNEPNAEGGKAQSGGWDAKKEPENSVAWGSAGDSLAPASSEGWGAANKSGESQPGGWGSKNSEPANSVAWDSAGDSLAPASSEGWGAANKSGESQPGGWGSKKSEPENLVAWGSTVDSEAPGSSEGWGAATAKSVKSGDSQPNGWVSKKSEPEKSVPWGSSVDAQAPTTSEDWGADKSQKSGNSQPGTWGFKKSEPETSVAWGSAVDSQVTASSEGWGATDKSGKSGNSQPGGWGSKNREPEKSVAWGSAAVSQAPAISDIWGATNKSGKSEGSQPSGWGSKKSEPEKSLAWGSAVNPQEPASSEVWDAANKSSKSTLSRTSDEGSSGWNQSEGWASKKNITPTSNAWGSSKDLSAPVGSQIWDSASKVDESFDKSVSGGNSGGWGAQSNSLEVPNTWGVSKKLSVSSEGWDSENKGGNSSLGYSAADDSSNKITSQASDAWGPAKEFPEGGWGAKKNSSETSKAWPDLNKVFVPAANEGKESSWGQPSKKNDEEDVGWGSANAKSQLSDSPGWNAEVTGSEAKLTENQSQWGQPGGSSSSDQWQEAAASQGWMASKSDNGSEHETQSPWGQQGQGGGSTWKKKGPSTAYGSSDTSDWKNRRSNGPPRPPRPSDNPKFIMYTVTRQRVDTFTAEEQEILPEVEPVLRSIRRIMYPDGYTDGDPLSTEDQAYIVENVLAHHPDKDAKLGAGLDHIMVAKHSTFQDSKCMYVVSVDGQKQDFSYRKCLENLVKKKFPDHAESFFGKYWSRPRNVGAQEQGHKPQEPEQQGQKLQEPEQEQALTPKEPEQEQALTTKEPEQDQ